MTVLENQGMEVRGQCPACGLPTLFVGTGGYLTCSLIDCPMPDAASRILEELETAHIVILEEDSWSAVHPLVERIDDVLLNCPVALVVADMRAEDTAPGTYRVRLTGHSAEWVKTP